MRAKLTRAAIESALRFLIDKADHEGAALHVRRFNGSSAIALCFSSHAVAEVAEFSPGVVQKHGARSFGGAHDARPFHPLTHHRLGTLCVRYRWGRFEVSRV